MYAPVNGNSAVAGCDAASVAGVAPGQLRMTSGSPLLTAETWKDLDATGAPGEPVVEPGAYVQTLAVVAGTGAGAYGIVISVSLPGEILVVRVRAWTPK